MTTARTPNATTFNFMRAVITCPGYATNHFDNGPGTGCMLFSSCRMERIPSAAVRMRRGIPCRTDNVDGQLSNGHYPLCTRSHFLGKGRPLGICRERHRVDGPEGRW